MDMVVIFQIFFEGMDRCGNRGKLYRAVVHARFDTRWMRVK